MGIGRSKNAIRTSSIIGYVVTRNSFVIQNEKSFEEYYELRNFMGRGPYFEVRQAMHRKTKQKRAVKIFTKSTNSEENYKKMIQEINILRDLDHSSIIQLYEYFDNNDFVYVIEERTEGDFIDYINESSPYPESTAAYIMKQLLSAISYMHSKGIAHRGINPINILLERNEYLCNIKIIEFFSASVIRENSRFTEQVGILPYDSPEILNNDYNQTCDEWSAGVFLYKLLCGTLPFTGQSDQETIRKIKDFNYRMNGAIWDGISDEAKDLIKNLLTLETSRISAKNALLHPWIQSNNIKSLSEMHSLEGIIENLGNYKSENNFRNSVRIFITNYVMLLSETERIRKFFNLIDIDGDGKLSIDDLRNGFKKISSKNIWDKIMKNVDTDGNRHIEYEEFLKAAISDRVLFSSENLRRAFELLDLNHNGRITLNELQRRFHVRNLPNIRGNIRDLIDEIGFDDFIIYVNSP